MVSKAISKSQHFGPKTVAKSIENGCPKQVNALIAFVIIFFTDSLNLGAKLAQSLGVKIVSKPFQTDFGRTKSFRELRKASRGLSRRLKSAFNSPHKLSKIAENGLCENL